MAPWECGRSQGTWAGGLIGYGSGYGSPGRSWSFDPDLDGDRDLFLSNGGGNKLFYNVGDGYYYSETDSGIGSTLSSSTPQRLTRSLSTHSQDIIPVDFDRDGQIELFCMWNNAPTTNRCEDPRVYFINDTTQAELSNQDSISLDVCEKKNNTYVNTDSSISIVWAYEQNSGYHVVSCSNGRVWPDPVGKEEYHTVVWFDGYEVVRQQEFVSTWSGVGGLGDLNGDGWIDHVYSPFGALDEWGNPLSNCTVALGDGTGLNSEIMLFETSSEEYNSYSNCNEGVHLIDIDGDGDLDISSDHSFLMNNQGTYEMAIHYGMNGDSKFWGDHRLVDWDGDGDLDRLMPGHIIYNPWFPDQDFDGIDDSQDQCPDTEDIDSVDQFGCSIYQIDSDEDGISDGYDICPQSDSSSSVDNDGCALNQKDSDNDGIYDSLDYCPNTPSGATVNLNGCENGAEEPTDSDGDGILDIHDICDNTGTGSTVDDDGCSPSQKDSDADGVNDMLDQCPETQTGAEVDNLGCSSSDVQDLDSDLDGVPNSRDSCPNTSPGSIIDNSGCEIDSNSETIQSEEDLVGFVGLLCCGLIIFMLFSLGNSFGEPLDGQDGYTYNPELTISENKWNRAKWNNIQRQKDAREALGLERDGLVSTGGYKEYGLTREQMGLPPLPEHNFESDIDRLTDLQESMNDLILENERLLEEKENLTIQIENELTNNEQVNELNYIINQMQQSMNSRLDSMAEMANEVENLRNELRQSQETPKELKSDYQDSVHQGDNVGQKVDTQVVNDADAIARITLDAYRQALKDMSENK